MIGYTFLLWSFATLSFYVSQSLALLASGVIFPLYIYPGTGCTGWTSVTSAIRNNNILQFYIIVNPNSGPGGAPGSQPDSNYQACIAALRTAGSASQNVKVLGYVATGFGMRSSTDVVNDINTYSQWASLYRPDGIFFDEGATTANLLPNYQAFASRVHQDFGTSFIVINPGTTPASSGYFNIADIIVTFEGFYNDFSSSNLVIGPSTPSHKQGVILHDGPTQAPFQIIDELASILDVGVSFITDFPNAIAYENIPTGLNSFLGNLVAAQTA
ncbi:Spherulation-specific family 4-domain-containing protein [Infundibulicybe gibba]|nr:Spherulation-specific family 4-domain-containing protein [Infundibulicybe gibba]